MQAIIGKIRTIDPKLVAAGVTGLLMWLIVQILPDIGVNIDLDATLVPGYLTVGQAIALAAAGAAGWWKANAGTLLRSPQESGNATPPDSVGTSAGVQA